MKPKIDTNANANAIVLASDNAGKLREIEALLAPAGLHLVPQGKLGIGSAEETGLSFVENAILKARHAARCSGRAAIADDSGIEVDALQGAPGIYSARYAGAESSDEANWKKLLLALAEPPGAHRSARFQCV
ncbi:MAG: non-canonical purine NTP pyrophosphatase, partial [Chromatiaceae bacterium]|nr:non-canonical purine NTP pyrophosphatase [Chromatiaceae bacterium]